MARIIRSDAASAFTLVLAVLALAGPVRADRYFVESAECAAFKDKAVKAACARCLADAGQKYFVTDDNKKKPAAKGCPDAVEGWAQALDAEKAYAFAGALAEQNATNIKNLSDFRDVGYGSADDVQFQVSAATGVSFTNKQGPLASYVLDSSVSQAAAKRGENVAFSVAMLQRPQFRLNVYSAPVTVKRAPNSKHIWFIAKAKPAKKPAKK